MAKQCFSLCTNLATLLIQSADPTQQHRNQLFSTIAFRQQQQLNNWPNINRQHQSSPKHQANDINTRQHNQANIKEANSSLLISNQLQVKQSCKNQQSANVSSSEADFNSEPTLDDKIRCLIVGNTDNEAKAKLCNSSNQLDNNMIYQQCTNLNSKSGNVTQTAWNMARKQSVSSGLISLDQHNTQKQQKEQQQLTGSSAPTNECSNQQPDLVNRIYVNEYNSPTGVMGNKQHRQYQINAVQSNTANSNQNSCTKVNGSSEHNNMHRKSDCQLIVDLTTPRVLARTQTTLLSANDLTNNQLVNSEQKNSLSVNQVGLPHILDHNGDNNSSTMPSKSTYDELKEQRQPLCDVKQLKNSRELLDKTEQGQSTGERSAPYYYSDLKSEDQRLALLNIVQQKSLSPPPQLLSRSTDQSSTRLALKSATLHSTQARLSSESLTQRQQRQLKANHDKNALKKLGKGEFSSTSSIAKDIDDLFCGLPDKTPLKDRESKISAVQSMLALNSGSNNNDVINIDSSRLSSFQTTSDSVSSGYCSSELKSKNFGRSKSLDNINQTNSLIEQSPNTELLNIEKSRNPVYENIRRSDKLMSALHNSTTCLSTSGNRECRKTKYVQDKVLEGSSDSILGSSLDGSDSSLDIIEEMKMSPSIDSSLTDITQLIEQLKTNHSKITEEYKSTLVNISKTINAKNSQLNGNPKSERLARRLQLLEMRSKKCESRSKNQLALIQMMEKVLRQSRMRALSCSDGKQLQQLNRFDSHSNNCMISEPQSISQRDQLCSSPCLSFDYQKHQKSDSLSTEAFPNARKQERASPLSNNLSGNSKSLGGKNQSSTRVDEKSGLTKGKQSVIKAIVTEGKNPIAAASTTKFVTSNSTSKTPKVDSKQQLTLSLSTLHQQSLQNSAKNLNPFVTQSKKATNGVVNEKKSLNAGLRSNNPFCRGGSVNGDADDSASSSTASSSIENEVQLNPIDNSPDLMGRDDEDFIEFLSADGSNHAHRSQFGGSQFSASDFNTSSNSESSASGAGAEPFNATQTSMISKNKQHYLKNGLITTGILKNSKINRSNECRTIENNNNSGKSNNKINVACTDARGDDIDGNSAITKSTDSNKFNNVLGNVIDVDVCPMNNQCSPVNNQASCSN